MYPCSTLILVVFIGTIKSVFQRLDKCTSMFAISLSDTTLLTLFLLQFPVSLLNYNTESMLPWILQLYIQTVTPIHVTKHGYLISFELGLFSALPPCLTIIQNGRRRYKGFIQFCSAQLHVRWYYYSLIILDQICTNPIRRRLYQDDSGSSIPAALLLTV